MKQLCFHPDCSAVAVMEIFACETHWKLLPERIRRQLRCLAADLIDNVISERELEDSHHRIRVSLTRERVSERMEDFIKSMGGEA